jgi:diaminopropionate ammonia-lyase
MMAGLACGEPNTIGWDILRNHSTAFLSCPDWVAALGMRRLAAPVKGDAQVVSGESGAVGMGVVTTLMTNPEYKDLKEALKLDSNSRVLIFSTEGDTDPENWRNVVWGGKQVD